MEIKDWKSLTFIELQEKYKISREEVYLTVLKERLYLHKPLIERGKMGELEEKYLVKAKDLSVSQLGNMFHKSYNSMLIFVKYKGYYDRINGRK